MKQLQDLMNSVAEWSDATFGEGERNPAILHHLKKEVPELIEAINEYQNNNSIADLKKSNKLQTNVFEEYADCMMLLLDSAHHFGISAYSLLDFTKVKLNKNKGRKWGAPDDNGVVEHIRDTEIESDCLHDRYCDQQTIDQKCKSKSGCNFKA